MKKTLLKEKAVSMIENYMDDEIDRIKKIINDNPNPKEDSVKLYLVQSEYNLIKTHLTKNLEEIFDGK
tara:strand:+ start:3547 stop:3750 length:204 start_codon:yes stop_codon:yes gene_type:complete